MKTVANQMHDETFIEMQPKDLRVFYTSLLSKPNLLTHADTNLEGCSLPLTTNFNSKDANSSAIIVFEPSKWSMFVKFLDVDILFT